MPLWCLSLWSGPRGIGWIRSYISILFSWGLLNYLVILFSLWITENKIRENYICCSEYRNNRFMFLIYLYWILLFIHRQGKCYRCVLTADWFLYWCAKFFTASNPICRLPYFERGLLPDTGCAISCCGDAVT